ncbi:MAG: TIGR02996 domain-containing protein [Myxococcaceae bacterium]|nr:TIGR02996 domain-containing protein [Myxococcaceae bacterium]
MNLSQTAASPADLERLRAALRRANGTRQVRLLTEAQVEETVARALTSSDGLAVLHGGEANDGTQRTTLCLAVREGDFVTVGIGLSGAAGAGPGRTWKTLQPWSRTDASKNTPRLQAWARAKAPDRVRLRVVAGGRARPAAPDDSARLLAAVLASPADDAPRAVYADWLLERGDPHGEFISLQLALARRANAAKQARADALLAQHRLAWTEALRQVSLKQRFERGFVFELELKATTFVLEAARLFSLAPLTSVILRAAELPVLRKVVALPQLARLTHLGLDRTVGDAGARLLAGAPGLRQLEALSCAGCGFTAEGYEAVLSAMPALKTLRVRAVDDALAALVLPRRKLVLQAARPAATPLVRQLAREGRLELQPRA